MSKKTKILLIIITIVTSILIAFLLLGIYYKLNPRNIVLSIESVSEEKNKLFVNLSSDKEITKYFIEVYDETNNILLEKKSVNSKIDISSLILEHDENVIIKAYGINKLKQKIVARNEYKYTNTEASFSKIDNHFADNKRDINLYLNGYDSNKTYKLEVYEDEKLIVKYDDESGKFVIKQIDLENHNNKLTAKLKNKNNRVISMFDFYLNAPIVNNIYITTPENNLNSIWDDIKITHSGGDNANLLKITVFDKKNKKVFYQLKPFDDEEIIIPASSFKENESYTIELFATYNDYEEVAKTDRIKVNIGEKQTTNPVYINKNNTFIKQGTLVSLASRTEDATIYYTTDGSKPNLDSKIYIDPIEINENMTIKTYAVRKNMADSDINEYKFNVSDKKLVVYLSPSNQYGNKGVKKVGYTNEKEMMNKLADYLEKDLKEAGVKVYRNNKKSGALNDWTAESNRVKSDLHLAIHSNASELHDTKGMEIYIDKQTSKSLSIATNIYNNLYEIYPNKDDTTNRGVKYANGSLGEANDAFVTCGTLIEVAYHDDYDDAKWLVDDMEEIARNMANTILDFYGLI